MFVGNMTYHAICNLEEFQLGIGGQGRTVSWPERHIASHRNDVETVKGLVKEDPKGFDVDDVDEDGKTALYRAVTAGHFEVSKLLIENKAELLPTGDRDDLVMQATKSGTAAIVRLLADNRAYLQRADKKGEQPIHWAAREGHLETLQYLLQAGVSPNHQNSEGVEVIHRAAAYSDPQTVEMVLAHGGEVEAMAGAGMWQPLHFAAGGGHAAMVNYLVGSKAQIDAEDSQGAHPLYVAVTSGHAETVEALIGNRADIFMGPENSDGLISTPLQAAEELRWKSVEKVLLAAGAVSNQRVPAGRRRTNYIQTLKSWVKKFVPSLEL